MSGLEGLSVLGCRMVEPPYGRMVVLPRHCYCGLVRLHPLPGRIVAIDAAYR